MRFLPFYQAFALSALIAGVSSLSACTPSKSKTPGIELGAPEIRWADKSAEQKMGFMAAQVHPTMHKVFADYDSSYSDPAEFTCEICHGEAPEQVNWAMPSPDIYSLPADDPIGVAMSDDPEVGNFMMGTVTPALQQLFDKGKGTPTKANCFSCHPVED